MSTKTAKAGRKTYTMPLEEPVTGWLAKIEAQLLDEQPHRESVPPAEITRYALCRLAESIPTGAAAPRGLAFRVETQNADGAPK